MEAIFIQVLETSLYASAAGIVVLLLKAVLGNKISPKWHYFIWIVLVAKLLVPYGPESSVSLFNAIPEISLEANFPELYQEYRQPYNPAVQPADKQYLPASPTVEETQLHPAAAAKTAVPYIWLAGAVMMLAWLLYAKHSLKRKIGSSAAPVPDLVNLVFEESKRRMRVRKNIEIVIQNVVSTPALFGLFKPRILLAPSITGLNGREISYILLHELAHYKTRDLIVNHLLLLLQVIHWFNPVIWYCFKRIRQDMEMAADERVLSLLGPEEQKEYGKALLSVVESFSLPRIMPRLVGMVDDKENIKKRIRMIKMAEFFKSKRRTVVFTGVICIAILCAILMTNALTKQAFSEVDNGGLQAAASGGENEPDRSVDTAGLPFKLLAYPEKYSLLMSSSPGIGISSAQFADIADKVGYSATYGTLLTLDASSGITGKYGQSVEMPPDKPVFWSPLADEGDDAPDEVTVKAVIMNNNAKLAEKQVKITFDASNHTYIVTESEDVVIADIAPLQPQKPKTVDEAVGLAVKAQGKGYLDGEVATEGHVILESEEKDGIVKVYTVSSFGWFGFENGIFTKISGSGAIPTVMTFSKNKDGEYTLKEYKKPMDGAYYGKSIKEMFPERLWDKVLKTDKYSSLAGQQEEQAKLYLKSIGRDAEVSVNHVKKTLPEIDTEASNKLFAGYTKYDAELNTFPYWLGTRELLKDGERYIYETSQSKTDDGYDLITFRKTKEDGAVLKEYRYKIVGSEPLPVE